MKAYKCDGTKIKIAKYKLSKREKQAFLHQIVRRSAAQKAKAKNSNPALQTPRPGLSSHRVVCSNIYSGYEN